MSDYVAIKAHFSNECTNETAYFWGKASLLKSWIPTPIQVIGKLFLETAELPNKLRISTSGIWNLS